jgi:hypothetical protein
MSISIHNNCDEQEFHRWYKSIYTDDISLYILKKQL